MHPTRTLRLALSLPLALGAGLASAANLDFWTGKYTVTGDWTGSDGNRRTVAAVAEIGRSTLEGSTQVVLDEHTAGTRGGIAYASWVRVAPDVGDGFFTLFRGDGQDGSASILNAPSAATDLVFTTVPGSRADAGRERISVINISGNSFALHQELSTDGGATWTEAGHLNYSVAPANTTVRDPGLGACGSPLHQSLGFMAGEWQFNPPAGATAKTFLRMANCVYLEIMDLGATGKSSITMGDSRSGAIRRLEVEPTGKRYFMSGLRIPEGGPISDMRLTGNTDGGTVDTLRVTWSSAASVLSRETEEVSANGGVSWTGPNYDRFYSRPPNTTGGSAGGPFPGQIPTSGNQPGGGGGGGPWAPLAVLGLLIAVVARRARAG